MLAALNVALAFALGFDEPGRFWAGGVLAGRAAAACSCARGHSEEQSMRLAALWIARVRQTGPTGKSLLIFRNRVKTANQNIPLSFSPKSVS